MCRTKNSRLYVVEHLNCYSSNNLSDLSFWFNNITKSFYVQRNFEKPQKKKLCQATVKAKQLVHICQSAVWKMFVTGSSWQSNTNPNTVCAVKSLSRTVVLAIFICFCFIKRQNAFINVYSSCIYIILTLLYYVT